MVSALPVVGGRLAVVSEINGFGVDEISVFLGENALHDGGSAGVVSREQQDGCDSVAGVGGDFVGDQALGAGVHGDCPVTARLWPLFLAMTFLR